MIGSKAERFDVVRNFFLSEVGRLGFGLKILVQIKAIWLVPETAWGKLEHLYCSKHLQIKAKRWDFVLKFLLSKANRFLFSEKILGWSRTMWCGPKIVAGKAEHF